MIFQAFIILNFMIILLTVLQFVFILYIFYLKMLKQD